MQFSKKKISIKIRWKINSPCTKNRNINFFHYTASCLETGRFTIPQIIDNVWLLCSSCNVKKFIQKLPNFTEKIRNRRNFTEKIRNKRLFYHFLTRHSTLIRNQEIKSKTFFILYSRINCEYGIKLCWGEQPLTKN